MKKKLSISVGFILAFLAWTIALCFIDVKVIGPQGSAVGFAAINSFFHNLTGVNFFLYTITDWLGLVPIAVCLAFGLVGLVQWIRRKSILKVDKSILVLGVFYIATIAVYLLFEYVIINYRPVLINGYLEVSYPSSTTLLTMCVMPTLFMQLRCRIKYLVIREVLSILIIAFTAFMVVGRLISGVHWLTDIIGGLLLSAGLVTAYSAFSDI